MFLTAAGLKGFDQTLLLFIQILMVMILTFVQALVRPFKSIAIEVLDLSFMLNYLVLAVSALYLEQSNKSDTSISTYILVSIAFIEFIGILSYHIMKWAKRVQCSKCLSKKNTTTSLPGDITVNYGSGSNTSIANSNRNLQDGVVDDKINSISLSEGPHHWTVHEFSKYREPLLSDSHNSYKTHQ